jgi:hypothetical protein
VNRRVLALTLATIGLSLAATVAANSPPAHAANRIVCGNECLAYKYWTGSNPPGWFKVEWATNENIWFIRGVANCGDGRQTVLERGGWVTTTDLFSKATCPSSLPVLIGGAYDIKHCSSCSFTRTVPYGHMNPAGRMRPAVKNETPIPPLGQP